MAFTQGATSGSPHVANFLSTLNAFLVANGWTLIDTISATDHVYSSAGNGRERIFVRFTQNVNRTEVRAFQFWDAITTHAGSNQAGNTGGTTGLDGDNTSSYAFWIWTDARGIGLATKVGSTYSGCFAGTLDRVHDGNVGFSAADVAAGPTTIVTLDQSFNLNADWQPGKKLFVADLSRVLDVAGAIPAELATVVAVTSTTVTLLLAQAHKAGAMVGVDPQPVVVSPLNVIGGNFLATNHIAGWLTPAGAAYAAYMPFDGADDDADPNDRTLRYLVQPMYLRRSTAGQTEIRGKLPGLIVPTVGGAGIGNEDTTNFNGAPYVALPVGPAGRQILFPMT